MILVGTLGRRSTPLDEDQAEGDDALSKGTARVANAFLMWLNPPSVAELTSHNLHVPSLPWGR